MKKLKSSAELKARTELAKHEEGVENNFALGKSNYIMILIGVVIVITGFALMTGGGSKDPNVFLRDEIFSPRRITWAPVTVLAGYIFVIYAIMKKS